MTRPLSEASRSPLVKAWVKTRRHSRGYSVHHSAVRSPGTGGFDGSSGSKMNRGRRPMLCSITSASDTCPAPSQV